MTGRPLDCDAEQERRAFEWIDDDAKITHAEDGESAPRLTPMGWDGLGCLFVSRGRVGIHLLRFLPFLFFFAPDWKFFLRISLFHPPFPSPSGLHPSFLPSFLFHLQMEGKQCRAELGCFRRHFSPDRVPRRRRRYTHPSLSMHLGVLVSNLRSFPLCWLLNSAISISKGGVMDIRDISSFRSNRKGVGEKEDRQPSRGEGAV